VEGAYVAPMKGVRIACRDLGINGTVKLYLKKSAQSGLDSSGSGLGSVAGSCVQVMNFRVP
jgi:hypothetical protein